jgi:exonuclease VII small subunit
MILKENYELEEALDLFEDSPKLETRMTESLEQIKKDMNSVKAEAPEAKE